MFFQTLFFAFSSISTRRLDVSRNLRARASGQGGEFLTESTWGVRRAAVQFDKVDEHQTVRRLAIIFGLSAD